MIPLVEIPEIVQHYAPFFAAEFSADVEHEAGQLIEIAIKQNRGFSELRATCLATVLTALITPFCR